MSWHTCQLYSIMGFFRDLLSGPRQVLAKAMATEPFPAWAMQSKLDDQPHTPGPLSLPSRAERKFFPNPLSHSGSVTSSLLLSPTQNNNGEKRLHNSGRRKLSVRGDVNDGGVTKNTDENEMGPFDEI